MFAGWFGSWWEGEHVCIEKEETEEGVASYRDFHFTFKIAGADFSDKDDDDDEDETSSSSSSTYIHEVKSWTSDIF